MKGRSASKIKLTSYDELLGGGEETNDIQQVSLEHLHSFENHPFQVNDDEAMAELVESVKEEGILTALLVRPLGDGEYEIIAGHRRRHAAQLAGLKEVPVIIRNMDSEGRINTEHMTSDALMTAMKTMEELTQMKMDRLVLETTMEMILCMFESCDTEEFTEILGKLLGGKQTSKVTAHLEALEELLTEEEYSSFLAEYLGYLTVNVAEFIRSTIIENGLMLLAGSGGEEDGEEDGEDGL